MVIGMVTNSAWNIWNFRRDLVKRLQAEGHEVVAIAPDDGFAEQVRSLGCRFFPLQMANKGTSPVQDLSLAWQLWQAYKAAGVEIALHFTIKPNIYGTLAAALHRIPSVCNVTGLGTVFIRSGMGSRIAHLLYKIAFRFPVKVFFQNADDQSLFLEKELVHPKITSLIPGSGVNLQEFKPSVPPSGPFTFLMVARLLYDKGITEYIGAIRQLKQAGVQARFLLLGGLEPNKGLGIGQEQLEEWIQEGLVEYLGKVTDVRPVVAQAHCVVLPSYREGTPRSLLEAASQGKPLLTTDVPGCRETVIDGYNGLLCQVQNTDDLATKMKQFLDMTAAQVAQMGQNSRQLAESRFDQQRVFQQYLNAIELCRKMKAMNGAENGRYAYRPHMQSV